MSAGPRYDFSHRAVIGPPLIFHSAFYRYEYLWEDGVRYKRPTKLPAPEYVDALMNWAQAIIDDEAMFPNKIGILSRLSSALTSPKFWLV